jgi:hypothetical protein
MAPSKIKLSITQIVLIALLGFGAILIVAWGVKLVRDWNRLQDDLRETNSLIQASMDNLPVDQIKTLLMKTEVDLGTVRADLQPVMPFIRLASNLPGIGKYAAQVEPGLDYAAAMVRAGVQVMQVVQPVWYDINRGGNIPGAVTTMQDGGIYLAGALASLHQAEKARSSISPALLPAGLRNNFIKIDNNFSTLENGIRCLQMMPGLLGSVNEQTYLLLAQNEDEIRGTGGFITAVGLASVDKGEITRFEIGDSYSIDDLSKDFPDPPLPLQQYMDAGIWLVRDANWSPDFPIAAQQVEDIYHISQISETDGVIAFDQAAVRKLLKVLGPVYVPGFSEQVTADNVVDYMHQAWAPEPDKGLSAEWWANRKNFISSLGKILVQKLLSTKDKSVLADLAGLSLDLINEGHVLIYFNNPDAQAVLSDLKMDGAVHRPDKGDFVMLVDSNVGFNKADAAIKRSITYSVNLNNPEKPTAQLTVHYQHPVQKIFPCIQEARYSTPYRSMTNRCYWDYWRVLTNSSRLTGWQIDPVPTEQLMDGKSWNGQPDSGDGDRDTQYTGGMMVLPTNQSKDIILHYDLPVSAVRSLPHGFNYSLRVQKQSALQQLPFTLKISVPANLTLVTQDKGWVQLSDGLSWSWNGILTQEQDFNLVFAPR